MLYSLAARPSCPSAAALRSNELRASTWSGLPKSAGPRHAPPRGLPPAAYGAVAPRFAPLTRRSRATTRPAATQRHGFSRSGSLRRSSVNIRRQSRVRMKPRSAPAKAGPDPHLGRPSPVRWQLKEKRKGATGGLLFQSTRRDFTYAVQGLLVRSSLRSTLSRSGVISLGSSKKYSGGYEAFPARAGGSPGPCRGRVPLVYATFQRTFYKSASCNRFTQR
jgi:hypothetical protein